MELREFGPGNRKVPVIGQGTWYIDSGQRAAAIAALRRGLDLGMTHIDTAEMYGNGAAERIVGEAIAGRREEVFLVSKVVPQHASRAGTIAACEKSLERLKTDHLDCYLLHWPGSHPLEETLAGFEHLQQAGSILSWGVSNFDVDGLDEIVAIAGEGFIACNQVLYHLQERAIEHAVMPWCEAHDVALVATAHSDMLIFQVRAAQAHECCRRSQTRTTPRRGRSRCAISCAIRVRSPSRRHRALRTSKRMQAPEICN